VVSVAGALGYDVTFKLKPKKARTAPRPRVKMPGILAGSGKVRKVAKSRRSP
jgi:hypothetical protein